MPDIGPLSAHVPQSTLAAVVSKLRAFGRASGSLSGLCAAASCQLSLDLDRYSFNALPADAAVPLQDAGQRDASDVSRPADAADAEASGGGCGPCDVAHAASVCESGRCAIARCRLGYRDDNDIPSDGCETPDVATDGLLLWFMADRGVTTDAGGLVSVWQDQSANAWEAIPPSPGASPHRVAVAGDRVALEFDGNDELALPALPAFSSLSFFAVVEAQEGPRCPSFLHVSNRVNLDTENEIEIGRHEGSLYYEVGSDNLMASGFFAPETLQLASVTHAPADQAASLYLGGALIARGAVPLPASVQRAANYIGYNHWDRPIDGMCAPFLGRMGEMLLYRRGMADSEREVIEGYLAEKWGVSVTPP